MIHALQNQGSSSRLMTLLGLGHTGQVVIMTVLAFGIVQPHIWPFVNLCPQRGTFPMVPGCRVFCLCYRPGGAGRLLACPENYRFNPDQERCTADPEVCEANKQCDPPALLDKAEELVLKDMKTECETTGMTYCANRWELIVCHPVWSHMLGVIECDRHGDGSYICNLMTDSCEKNRSALWESLGNIDSAAFGTAPGENCEVGGGLTPTAAKPIQSSATTPSTEEYEDETIGITTTTVSTATQPEDEIFEDLCNLVDHWPNAECRSAGSWCLPDLETIVTCGEKRRIRQVRNCKEAFRKEGVSASCLPIVFGCAYWPEKPKPAGARSVQATISDRQIESFGAWFREHWCKTHGLRGFVCTPDGNSLAHCNESLLVDFIFNCESIKPERLLLGCQYCEPGTAFCIYRPRADLADTCGEAGPKDNHQAMCGFFMRGRRRVPELRVRRDFITPYSTTAVVQIRRAVVTHKELQVTKRTML